MNHAKCANAICVQTPDDLNSNAGGTDKLHFMRECDNITFYLRCKNCVLFAAAR